MFSMTCFKQSRIKKNGVSLIVFLFFFPDEHNDVQKKTFTKWINARFSKVTLS